MSYILVSDNTTIRAIQGPQQEILGRGVVWALQVKL